MSFELVFKLFFFVLGVIIQNAPAYLLIYSGHDTPFAGVGLIAGAVLLPILFVLAFRSVSGSGWMFFFTTIFIVGNWINWGIAFIQGKDPQTGKSKFNHTIHGSANIVLIVGLLAVLLYRFDQQIKTKVGDHLGELSKCDNKRIKEFGGKESVEALAQALGINSGRRSSFLNRGKNKVQLSTDCKNIISKLAGMIAKDERLNETTSKKVTDVLLQYNKQIKSNGLRNLIYKVAPEIEKILEGNLVENVKN